MAENVQNRNTATSLASDFVAWLKNTAIPTSIDPAARTQDGGGALDDQSWDLQEHSFYCHFDGSIDNDSVPSSLTETASGCSPPLVENYQNVVLRPGLDMMISGIEDRPYSHNGVKRHHIPATSQFVCDQCGKYFNSQKDVDRHTSSVHDKSTPYFCREPGCHRPGRGFTRKDNFEKHLRDVHRKVYKIPNRVNISQVGPINETMEEESLEGCTKIRLIEMLMKEREICAMETRKRQELEEELKSQRQRYEEREDMWLKILMSKGAK